MHASTHARAHTCMHLHTHTHTHTCMHLHTHTHTRAYTNTLKTHMHASTHACTQTQTVIELWCLLVFLGMTRDDLFNTNASIVKNLVEACAKLVTKNCSPCSANLTNYSPSVFQELSECHDLCCYQPCELHCPHCIRGIQKGRLLQSTTVRFHPPCFSSSMSSHLICVNCIS